MVESTNVPFASERVVFSHLSVCCSDVVHAAECETDRDGLSGVFSSDTVRTVDVASQVVVLALDSPVDLTHVILSERKSGSITQVGVGEKANVLNACCVSLVNI